MFYVMKAMIGSLTIEVDGDDDILHIKAVNYKGTPRLYELLFMKHPIKTCKRRIFERVYIY